MTLKEESHHNFAIEYKGREAGIIGLIGRTNEERLCAEVGYWLGEPFWGKGIATQALQSVTRFGFEELNLLRIFAGVFEFNKASMRVLEKCGYQLEGILRKAVIKNGVVCDKYLYAQVR